jgi:hypothetical protein
MPIRSNIPQCTHIKLSGYRCRGNALKGQPFCFFHGRTRQIVKTHLDTKIPEVLILEDAESIQGSLMQIIDLLLLSQIEVPRARLIVHAIEIAARNVKNLRANTANPDPDDGGNDDGGNSDDQNNNDQNNDRNNGAHHDRNDFKNDAENHAQHDDTNDAQNEDKNDHPNSGNPVSQPEEMVCDLREIQPLPPELVEPAPTPGKPGPANPNELPADVSPLPKPLWAEPDPWITRRPTCPRGVYCGWNESEEVYRKEIDRLNIIIDKQEASKTNAYGVSGYAAVLMERDPTMTAEQAILATTFADGTPIMVNQDPIRRRRFAWNSSAEFQQRINQLKLKCS